MYLPEYMCNFVQKKKYIKVYVNFIPYTLFFASRGKKGKALIFKNVP